MKSILVRVSEGLGYRESSNCIGIRSYSYASLESWLLVVYFAPRGFLL